MSKELNLTIDTKREILGKLTLGDKEYNILSPSAKQMIQFQKFGEGFKKSFPDPTSEATIESTDPEVLESLIQEFIAIAIPELKDVDLSDVLGIKQYAGLGIFMGQYMEVVTNLSEEEIPKKDHEKEEENKS